MGTVADQLDIAPRLNGRAKAPLEVAYVRDLTEADIALLGTERGVQAPARKRLRDRHHSLARLLASGTKPWEAAAITGYSASTISILQNDPSFQELVRFYQDNENAQYAEFSRRAGIVTLTALDNIQEQVEDESNPLTLEQNLTIVKALADRTGHAPIQRSVNAQVNVDISGRLAAAKQRLAARTALAMPLIEAEFEEVGEPVAATEPER